MKKLICIIIALTLSLTAFASGESYADLLNKLGLFNGTDSGYDLDMPLTREQAAVMLTRLLGVEKEAEKADYDAVFDDVNEDRWSYPYVMYCYENKITNGTGKYTFSPENIISAEQFTALVLRVLGYESEPDTALDTAVKYMMLSSSRAKELADGDFTRGDMVELICRAIRTRTSDGRLFAYIMAENGFISNRDAEKLDLYKSASDITEIIDSIL